MCGIFGISARQGAGQDEAFLQSSLRILMAESQSRGKDSSGLAIRDEERGLYRVFKGPVQLNALLRDRGPAEFLDHALRAYGAGTGNLLVIGHSRLVTNGSQLHDQNNQPVLTAGIVGIHNGIIVNDGELWACHQDLRREFAIDTEVLLAILRKRLTAGFTLPAAIASCDREIEGTFSAALVFEDLPALALATNNGSLYTLTDGRDILMFASEEHPLRVVIDRMHLKAARWQVRQMVSCSGMVLWLDRFTLEPFDFAAVAVEPEAASTREGGPRFRVEASTVGSDDSQHLVCDVTEIARSPRAASESKMLEYNQARIDALRRCSRCVLPETFPFIEFDAQGVCNYCRNYRLRNQPKPIEGLIELLEPYRRTNGQPDCIVPFSGGRDSTFALHVIKTQLGLNPIAFTYDWGMVTDLGRRNIARACGKLGVENIIVAADIRWKRENIRKNIAAWLRKPHLGMIPLFMAGDKFFYYYVDRVKKHTGIKLNIWGINPLENTDFKVGFMGVPPDFEKKRIYSLTLARQARLLGGVAKAVVTNPTYINQSVLDSIGSFVSRTMLPHRDYFHLYDYVRWDERQIDALLLNEYGWEKAVDTESTWRIGDGTAAFYNYIYYTVAGFTEHDTFRSNQIREGAITREEALRRIRDENVPRYPTIRWYTEVVGVDYADAVRVINAIPKLYP